jgi:hypothetical protein
MQVERNAFGHGYNKNRGEFTNFHQMLGNAEGMECNVYK